MKGTKRLTEIRLSTLSVNEVNFKPKVINVQHAFCIRAAHWRICMTPENEQVPD